MDAPCCPHRNAQENHQGFFRYGGGSLAPRPGYEHALFQRVSCYQELSLARVIHSSRALFYLEARLAVSGMPTLPDTGNDLP